MRKILAFLAHAALGKLYVTRKKKESPLSVGQRARAITYTRRLNAPELASTLCRPTAGPNRPSTRPAATPRRWPFSKSHIASETTHGKSLGAREVSRGLSSAEIPLLGKQFNVAWHMNFSHFPSSLLFSPMSYRVHAPV